MYQKKHTRKWINWRHDTTAAWLENVEQVQNVYQNQMWTQSFSGLTVVWTFVSFFLFTAWKPWELHLCNNVAWSNLIEQDQYRVWTCVPAKHSSNVCIFIHWYMPGHKIWMDRQTDGRYSFIPPVFVCGSIITGEHLQYVNTRYVYKHCAKSKYYWLNMVRVLDYTN